MILRKTINPWPNLNAFQGPILRQRNKNKRKYFSNVVKGV